MSVRSERGVPMDAEDFITVSVDDHVIEVLDMLHGRVGLP